MKWLKNPMSNAIYIAVISSVCAAIFIISSGFIALRRKRFDEYQIISLEKIILINGIFVTILFPLSVVMLVFAPIYFAETVFALALFQWIVIVIAEVFYLTKNYKI